MKFIRRAKEKIRRWRLQFEDQRDRSRSQIIYASRRQKIKKSIPFLFNYMADLLTSKAGWYKIFKLNLAFCLLIIFSSLGIYFYYRTQLPITITELQSCAFGQPTEFYDRSGLNLLWTYRSDDECQAVPLKEISPIFIETLIAIEDKDFYKHKGFKITSILRATYNTMLGKKQGGSTITQQYIKNAVISDSRQTLDRKIKEIIFAPELESLHSKDEILNAYLNTISFGSIYSGIESAAQNYFDKAAKDLTLDESALLVAALPSPQYYWQNPKNHLLRRDNILAKLLQKNIIDHSEYSEAVKIDTLSKIKTKRDKLKKTSQAPFFLSEARLKLVDIICQTEENKKECYDRPSGGHKVITTLDINIQRQIEAAVKKTLSKEASYENAGLVAIDTASGQILGLQGSVDYAHPKFGQFNVITNARPALQSLYPFLYAAAISKDHKFGGGRILYDYPTFPALDQEEFSRRISFREALQNSLPTPAAKMAYIAQDEIQGLISDLGLDPLECEKECFIEYARGENVKIILDQLTNAYATLGRMGDHQDLSYIKSVADAQGRIIYDWQPKSKRIFQKDEAFIINHILSQKDKNIWQTDLSIAAQRASDDLHHYIVGYSSKIALGGFLRAKEINAFEAQNSLLNNFFSQHPIKANDELSWPQPEDIRQLSVNKLSGQISETGVETDYYPAQIEISQINQPARVKINPKNNKLLPECAPEKESILKLVPDITPELENDDGAYLSWLSAIIKYDNLPLPQTIDQKYKCP